MIYRNFAGIMFVAIFVCSCASGSSQKLQAPDARACAQNFTAEGNFLSGRTFKTHQFLSGVNKKTAMERATKNLAKEGGLTITNIDKEIGIISATVTNTSLGKNRSTPLSMVFDSIKKDVDVSLSFSVSGGQMTSEESIKEDFCQILSNIAKK